MVSDDELQDLYDKTWEHAVAGGDDPHMEALRAVYNAGLDRAAEIAREAYPLGSRVLGDAPSKIAAAIEAEKGQAVVSHV